MINCSICGRKVKSVILQGSAPNIVNYCDICWYYKNPPILVLTKLWSAPYNSGNESDLFSPKAGKRVYIATNQMDKCGFKLFNKKMFFKKEKNEMYREVLVFRYSGQLRCLALKEYRSWPSYMKPCNKLGCYLY